jgi:hypothetical protein
VQPGPIVLGILCLAWAGCERDPLDVECPELSVGDLVVTELRGPQSGEDIYGEWVELYNASSRTIALRGTFVRFLKLDGASGANILVRSALSAPAGSYITLGRQPQTAPPTHVNYGYQADFDSNMFDTAAVEVLGCDRDLVIDQAIYRNLPNSGTLGVDGMFDPPSASDNDSDLNWCVDDLEDANSETDGIRGTPQELNRPCN